MKIAFLTEMGFAGKILADHPNMRTEFAWMHALNADHYTIRDYSYVKGYDHVFILFPKGKVYLSAEGSKILDGINPISDLLESNLVESLKMNNSKIHYVQEGPHWWYNDYELVDQIAFYNMLASCDTIFAHNQSDVSYYKGLMPNKRVYTLPTLMIDALTKDIIPQAEEKVIIGGNFARWYGGFESYIIAQLFNIPVWGQTSHAMRSNEDQLINHLPRVLWVDWMKQLSSFKYAIHLMPTVAAGTFSLNCAYFGIPCIGNNKVDTQAICHPDLAIDLDDLEKARSLAGKLQADVDFYRHCSQTAKQAYTQQYSINTWKQQLNSILLDNEKSN